MQATVDKNGCALRNGLVILMARLLGENGDPIRRTDVSFVDYSIYELDPCWPHQRTVCAGVNAVALMVGDVVFDSLQIDRLWTLDELGYNFRHEIRIDRDRPFFRAGFHYEVRYRFTDAGGRISVVRFSLGY